MNRQQPQRQPDEARQDQPDDHLQSRVTGAAFGARDVPVPALSLPVIDAADWADRWDVPA